MPAEVVLEMNGRADLHVHTTASDGALTPSEVVRAAQRLELAAVGIADHDTADGVEEALEAAKAYSVVVVPGIEISATQDSTEVHILGYFIDHKHPQLLEEMRKVKEARFERARLMVERLRAVGLPIRFERVLEIAQGGAVGRPHIARAIWEIGASSSVDAAFGKYLQPGGPGYVPRPKVPPECAVELVLEAGGVPCCAHVAKLRRDELILELIKKGLLGIEVYHPDHTSGVSRFYRRFAEKHSLVAVGGSDAHCIPGTSNGGIGSVTVDYGVVEQLKSLADKVRRARK